MMISSELSACDFLDTDKPDVLSLMQNHNGTLTPKIVSKFLIDLVSAPRYLTDSEISSTEKLFIQAREAKESWEVQVYDLLDCPDFVIPNKLGFRYLIKYLSIVYDELPMDFLYKKWKNKEGQMSWITKALKHQNVFSFASVAHTPVDISCLKKTPDLELRTTATWMSLELINILLLLSDDGFQNQVLRLMKFPMKFHPDLLLIGMLQVNLWNDLKRDVIADLLPVFINGHCNDVSIFEYMWDNVPHHQQKARALLLKSTNEWYLEQEQDPRRVNRVVNIFRDLKALPSILSGPPTKMVVDMACLAQGEDLNLEEWVKEKLQGHGDKYIGEWTDLVKARLSVTKWGRPEVFIGSPSPRSVEIQNFNILLTCIQDYLTINGNVSPAIREKVITMSRFLELHQQLTCC